jgi:hypothetical protein
MIGSTFSEGFLLSLSLCLDIGIVNVAMLSLTLMQGSGPASCSVLAHVSATCCTRRSRRPRMAALLQFEACAGPRGSVARHAAGDLFADGHPVVRRGGWRTDRKDRRHDGNGCAAIDQLNPPSRRGDCVRITHRTTLRERTRIAKPYPQ